MKKTLHILILFGMILVQAGAAAQNAIPRFNMYDCWGELAPSFYWAASSEDNHLNFNPSMVGGISLDSIPYAENYTIIAVYKTLEGAESNVWTIKYGRGIERGLTTKHIVSDSSYIVYADSMLHGTVINTLKQSAPKRFSSNIQMSVGDSNLQISELLYYDHRLSNKQIRRIQSALAIRYGATLGAVNYVSGAGNVIWDYKKSDGIYHNRIIGLANDTALCYQQRMSRSEVPGSILTVRTDSLSPGAYLLVGDNDGELSFEPSVSNEIGEYEVLSRSWLVQSTHCDSVYFIFDFDVRNFPLPTDSLILMINGEPYLPTHWTSSMATYEKLNFASEMSTITLAKGGNLWEHTKSLHQSKSRSNNGEPGFAAPPSGFSCRVFPNPTKGDFSIIVEGVEHVSIDIFDAQGRKAASYGDTGREQYRFDGVLPSGNSYYATICTEKGERTLKIVVE